MSNDTPEKDSGTGDPKPPIRRGRGLRLSTSSTPAEPPADAAPPPAEPPTPAPRRSRSRGPRLSTTATEARAAEEAAGMPPAGSQSPAPPEPPLPAIPVPTVSPEFGPPPVVEQAATPPTSPPASVPPDAPPAGAEQARPVAEQPAAPAVPDVITALTRVLTSSLPASPNGGIKLNGAELAEGLLVTRHVQVPQGTIAYRRLGEGPPLILVHGWGSSGRFWLGTMLRMAPYRTVYALDLAGFGDTPALRISASVARQAELLLAFADALGLEQFDMNGHSFGAAVAVIAAARQPERVRRLVLSDFGVARNWIEQQVVALIRRPAEIGLAAVHPFLNLWQPLLRPWQPLAFAAWTVPPVQQLLASWFFDQPPAEPWLLREGILDLLRMDVRAHLACMASIGDPLVLAALPALRAPTLVIGGRNDKFMGPDALAAVAALIPGSRLIILEHCGHLPMIERASEYHQAVQDFMQ